MKRALALLLALTMVLSLCACGGNSNDGVADSGESSLTAEQQMIVDAVCAQTQSDDFAGWQALYQDFSGETPKAAEVTAVKHFAIDDFEGEKLDCYLVNISADVAWWVNEEAQQGITDTQFQLFVSSDGKTVMNSILVDAGNFDGDISTPEGRAMYLLWIFGNMMSGNYDGSFVNDSETVTDWSADELAVINKNL